MSPSSSLSLRDARRIALASIGLAARRPGRPSKPRLLAAIDRLGLVQLDSVSVLTRAHYMPGFARLGAYDTAWLDAAAWGKRRTLFEYWGHEASLLPLRMQPLLRWRMEAAARGSGTWGSLARFAAEQPARVAAILAEVRDRGPLAAAELQDAGRAKGPWWGWSDGKQALEYLFWSGAVAVARRRGAFERVYDLAERVIPADIIALPSPTKPEAQRELVRLAARAMGVATGRDLAAYFRLPPADAKTAVAALVESGDLRPVAVEGWTATAYLHAEAQPPHRVMGAALVSPFDPLLWERDRAERLFGFRYRIEIYTPVEKREHGYYVLPFLRGDRLVARLDLEADRAGRRLLVPGAHTEAGEKPGHVVEALWPELLRLAAWLDLDTVEIGPGGDLAPALARSKPADPNP